MMMKLLLLLLWLLFRFVQSKNNEGGKKRCAKPFHSFMFAIAEDLLVVLLSRLSFVLVVCFAEVDRSKCDAAVYKKREHKKI
jgi:hypothetical protein